MASASKKRLARRRFLQQSSAALAASPFVRNTPAASPSAKSQAGAAASQTPAASAYKGPLPDVALPDRQFDSQAFSLSVYDGRRPALAFTAKTERAARQWQQRARRKVTQLLGGLPNTRAALRAEVLETRDFPGYTREKIIFQSREQLTVFGYLLLPKRRRAAVPAIVCLPGHGRGCDDIVGIAEDGAQRDNKPGYARDFALQVVEQGYAAFAIEQLAFGCRRDEAARRRGAGASSCQPAAGVALLFGETMIGWRVWDVMRAFDYLNTRSEIDGARLATIGISGGGTVSLFAAALDPRIKVAVVSGYFNTFRDSIVSLSHCIDNYVPGILNFLEMYDLAGLVAPRALFIESGMRDTIFPIAGSRKAFQEAQSIYRVFGAAERIEQEVFDDGHVFYGKGAFEFLRREL